ncbi:hypothetical protein DTL21_19090 [Bremerella cremea]|uniref:DUF6985 domain-containing protein n=1 Tax=Blastopirellula marina TaxID=124 RepID=A0A2S8FJI3_9BACT|nr:hypothetical protein C5Y83_19070 [Blastopirellula marina]RCS45395.1 hypothetical protein DTL21_19090 [Bremerella cremea]
MRIVTLLQLRLGSFSLSKGMSALTIEIPLLGRMTRDRQFSNWLCSEPIAVPFLNDQIGEFTLESYEQDRAKEDFHATIANLLAARPEVLEEIEPYLFQYYEDCQNFVEEEDEVRIDTPKDVWKFVRIEPSFMISRRGYGDEKVYVSFGGGVEWEEEHGLQIVMREGKEVVKIGPYDGHLTNSDAFDDETLENVIYVRVGQ